MNSPLVHENIWTERPLYEEAEQRYYESLNQNQNQATLTPLADEVAKARQRLSEIRENFEPNPDIVVPTVDTGAVKFLEKRVVEFQTMMMEINEKLAKFESRLQSIEDRLGQGPVKSTTAHSHAIEVPKNENSGKPEQDEDVDLFGSDSEEENEEAERIREERLAAYHAKKSTKPVLIAKSSIILDVKPWDDETDMKEMEKKVREIQMDGLLWGASKLVLQAYGIHKLQINCVIEDDKVSVDLLQEEIEKMEELVQSVDIAAFNKI